jgi:enolase
MSKAPIISIETEWMKTTTGMDGSLTDKIGDVTVGDDLFVTNVPGLATGIDKGN